LTIKMLDLSFFYYPIVGWINIFCQNLAQSVVAFGTI